jgi:hypothetical protein
VRAVIARAATLEGAAIAVAVGSENDVGHLRIHAIVAAGEQIQRREHPGGVVVGQFVHQAAAAGTAVSAYIATVIRGTVEVTGSIESDASHRRSAVTSAGEVVDDRERLPTRRGRRDGEQQRKDRSHGQ